MGSTKLIKKELFGYQKSKSNDNCFFCKNGVKVQIYGIGGVDLGTQFRCRLFGIDSSKKYRINPEYTCNKWEPDKELQKFKK